MRAAMASLIIWAITFLYAPAAANGTPTLCEFIAIELFEGVDRGDLSEKDAMDILRRCQKNEDKYS